MIYAGFTLFTRFLSDCAAGSVQLALRSAPAGRLRTPFPRSARRHLRENDSRVRHRITARNLALLLKITLYLLDRDRSSTANVCGRCNRAVWNDAYTFQILAGRSQSLEPW